jgi:hypothetical protein
MPGGARRRKMEGDWPRAFIHESGHAIMATMQKIRCHGIFLRQRRIKACNLIDPLPPPSGMSDKHYLYLAAGSAAEQIAIGDQDFLGSRKDREYFGNPPGTTFEEKVREAELILSKKKRLITTLASKLEEIVKKANGDFTYFPTQKVDAGDGIEVYWVLLSEDELKEILQRS